MDVLRMWWDAHHREAAPPVRGLRASQVRPGAELVAGNRPIAKCLSVAVGYRIEAKWRNGHAALCECGRDTPTQCVQRFSSAVECGARSAMAELKPRTHSPPPSRGRGVACGAAPHPGPL